MRPYHAAAIGLTFAVSLAAGAPTPNGRAHEPDLSADSVIKRVYIDRSGPYDPGTIVAVLHNRLTSPIHVGPITVNGTTVKDWPATVDPVLWHRVTRPILKPDQTGLILLKLAQYGSGMIRLQIQIDRRTLTRLVGTTDCEPVRIAAVRYNQAGTRLNVFLENTGKAREVVRRVRLDDRSVWEAPGSGLTISPGMTRVCRIALARPLTAGRTVQLCIYLADRVLGARNRAIPGFRISIESGDRKMAERIAADPLVLNSFHFRQEQTAADPSRAAPSLEKRQGTKWSLVKVTHGRFVSGEESDLACVFACPTHATDSYHTSAYLAMMAQRTVEKEPCWQSFIHACRSQPLRGLAMFGRIADCIRFNAQLKTAVAGAANDRDAVPWTVYQLVRYAVASAAPSRALPMIPVEKDRSLFAARAPLALEARQMVYAAVAAGAGGIAYRVMEKEWGKEARDQMIDDVTRVNHEIRQLRDYLAMGFPRPIASADDPKIQIACIDAAPEALVVILINHDVLRSPPEMPPSAKARQRKNVRISLDVPDGFDVEDVHEINGKSRTKVENVSIDGRVLRCKLSSVGPTKILLVTLRQGAK